MFFVYFFFQRKSYLRGFEKIREINVREFENKTYCFSCIFFSSCFIYTLFLNALHTKTTRLKKVIVKK